MWDISAHDYTHCNQKFCTKRHDCLRYQLFKEDLEYENKTGNKTYCTYFQISPEKSKTCTVFISKHMT